MKLIVTLVLDGVTVTQYSSAKDAYKAYTEIIYPFKPIHYATFCRRVNRLQIFPAHGQSFYSRFKPAWHFFHTQVDNIDTDTKLLHAGEDHVRNSSSSL